jgi:hypothetical protein
MVLINGHLNVYVYAYRTRKGKGSGTAVARERHRSSWHRSSRAYENFLQAIGSAERCALLGDSGKVARNGRQAEAER